MNTLQSELKYALDHYLVEQFEKYPRENLLKIDLHCHDCNSDEPDELLGRILNVPETWIPTYKVVEELHKNGCEVLTITNHNNARSCYALQEASTDVLTAAEFSCWVPDFNMGIHVLTYGFTPQQEKLLNELRKDIYNFQEYACANQIPTIWAHPLYHYAGSKMPPMEFFDKMLLIFERFEMINGQRDTWQNMLVKEWIDSVTPAKITALSEKYKIDPKRYCLNPYKKSLSGGSDSHMGFFAGLTGSYLYVPDLQKRLLTTSKSQLALEALRRGDMIPFGSHQNTEKLTISFLDYVCQIAINHKDPGLMRIMLHKGDTSSKLLAMLVTNAFAEAQRHRVTMSFIHVFHNALLGQSPSFLKKLIVTSAYKPVFDDVVKIAKAKDYYNSIYSINRHLNELLSLRLAQKLSKSKWIKQLELSDVEEIISQLELPSNIRAYTKKRSKTANGIDVNGFLDGLPFPFLGSLLLLSAHFTSARVMFNNRPFLKDFSSHLGKYRHPQRALWLTDTFEENNDVSSALQAIHREIKHRNLPIDLLVCSNTLKNDDHLIVMKPLCEFQIALYPDLPLRIPNFLELHHLFHEREYDRVICSTEGVMGALGLYLKYAYSVPASFFVHHDWMAYCRNVLNFDSRNQSRVRRFLRLYYGAFDHLFVFNKEQYKWFTSNDMNFDQGKVCHIPDWSVAVNTFDQST
ncbi:MAG: hypothetical protein FWD56_00815 [Bacteroidales bacterium]|nr:hypothetical protein [Bacteroidales bacterium]